MNGFKIFQNFVAIITVIALSGFTCTAQAQSKSIAADERNVMAHVRSIFQAFVDQDVDKIRATHSADWRGFQIGVREVTDGIDAYMANVRFVTPMQQFEIEDYDVQIYGDTAVVYYIANWWNHIPSSNQFVQVRARSVDIYRRESSGWIQIGSNINLITRPNTRGKPEAVEIFDLKFATELPKE